MHHVLRLNQVPISLSSSWPSLAAPQNSSPKVILSFSATLGNELSPAEQAAEIARAAKARKEWDTRMRDLKMKRQTCYEEE